MTDAPEWPWWCSTDEENYQGPFPTREEAVAELDGEAGWVCEAQQSPLRLADFIDTDLVIEDAENGAADLSNGDPIFDVTPEQGNDLEARLKRACDEWQDAHGLRFIPWAFAGMRNKTFIPSGAADA